MRLCAAGDAVRPTLSRMPIERVSAAWLMGRERSPRALSKAIADDGSIVARLRALQTLGHPYGDDEIVAAPAALEGRSELDAVIAYLQSLGLAAPAGEAMH